MTTNLVNPHITFNGTCEEAFNFYKSIFGGEFNIVSRFKDCPPMEGFSIDEEEKERIMHMSLPISKETVLMGNDTHGIYKDSYVAGNNFFLAINACCKEEVDRFFGALGEGGAVIVPAHDTFWGAYFGMVKDKFGVTWTITFQENPAQCCTK
jgi:PhnB protein